MSDSENEWDERVNICTHISRIYKSIKNSKGGNINESQRKKLDKTLVLSNLTLGELRTIKDEISKDLEMLTQFETEVE